MSIMALIPDRRDELNDFAKKFTNCQQMAYNEATLGKKGHFQAITKDLNSRFKSQMTALEIPESCELLQAFIKLLQMFMILDDMSTKLRNCIRPSELPNYNRSTSNQQAIIDFCEKLGSDMDSEQLLKEHSVSCYN